MESLKILASILLGGSLMTLVSCGNDDKSTRAAFQEEQQQEDQGLYRAVLAPINASATNKTTATVEIKIVGDEVIVESNITGAPSGVKHLQNITTSSACPPASADINADTFVDVAEALPHTGQILLPLDSDLSEQMDGLSYGPIANLSGNYVYRRSTTLTKLLADLQAPDPDSADLIAKLPAGENLNLSGRVIIVHGVATSTVLPDTVSTTGDHSQAESLPIACGVIQRISSEEAQPEAETETITNTIL
jgi:hypothetical protein